jgi:hypothetical protein
MKRERKREKSKNERITHPVSSVNGRSPLNPGRVLTTALGKAAPAKRSSRKEKYKVWLELFMAGFFRCTVHEKGGKMSRCP